MSARISPNPAHPPLIAQTIGFGTNVGNVRRPARRVVEADPGLRHPVELLGIETRTERTACTRDHDGANLGTFRRLSEQVVQRTLELARPAVVALGTVQGERERAVLVELVQHRGRLNALHLASRNQATILTDDEV